MEISISTPILVSFHWFLAITGRVTNTCENQSITGDWMERIVEEDRNGRLSWTFHLILFYISLTVEYTWMMNTMQGMWISYLSGPFNIQLVWLYSYLPLSGEGRIKEVEFLWDKKSSNIQQISQLDEEWKATTLYKWGD